MRLDFKVLWIDDQPKSIKSYAESLGRRLRDMGFLLAHDEVSTTEGVESFVKEHIHDDGIDLILIDYDLGTGTGGGGELALAAIRQMFPFKDIMFYSSVETDKLRELAYLGKVDGVHFSNRDSLVENTVGLVENMLRKVLDIDHMRGIVMAATSDIDFIIKKTLTSLSEKMSAEERQTFIKEIHTSVDKKIAKNIKEVEAAKKKQTLEAIAKMHSVFSAIDQLGALLKILGSRATDADRDHITQGEAYRDTTVLQRNKLAHLILRGDAGKKVLAGEGITFTVDDMTQLRKDLIEHRDNFKKIANMLEVSID